MDGAVSTARYDSNLYNSITRYVLQSQLSTQWIEVAKEARRGEASRGFFLVSHSLTQSLTQ